MFGLSTLIRLVAARSLAGVEIAAAAGVIVLEARLVGDGAPLGGMLHGLDLAVVACFALRLGWAAAYDRKALREPGTLAMALAVAASSLMSLRVAVLLALLHDATLFGLWLRRSQPRNRMLLGIGRRPAQSLVVSFLSLIGIGTLLLSMPAARAGSPVPWVDALFTAVSATCVTGLTTVDTATAWSPFGQAVILVLIQLGGLGIMAVSAAMTLAFGRELGLRQDTVLRSAFDEPDAEELRALLRALVSWTFAIEAMGALILFVRFAFMMPLDQALVNAVFHAVSAFCNAGFALFSDNLMQFASDPAVSLTVMALVIVGGFGFGVLVAIGRFVRRGNGRRSLPVHAKVVLVTSALLIWAGALLYFFFEYDRSLAPLGLGGKILASLFQSVTPRTAGYNTVPLGNLHPFTILLLMLLMFIGASPGSTGGGIKTTTVAIVALAIRSYLREQEHVEVFGRTLSRGQVLRALAVTGGAMASFLFGLGILLTTETRAFHELAFEVLSALGTVGLTLGVTPTLSATGRVVVAAIMFAGRVGPLTLVAAAATAELGVTAVKLPKGRVLVG